MKIACSKSEYDASRELTSKTEYVNNGINMKKMDKLLTNGSVVKSKKLRIVTLGRTAEKKQKYLIKLLQLCRMINLFGLMMVICEIH